jgi:hypothetical protein
VRVSPRAGERKKGENDEKRDDDENDDEGDEGDDQFVADAGLVWFALRAIAPLCSAVCRNPADSRAVRAALLRAGGGGGAKSQSQDGPVGFALHGVEKQMLCASLGSVLCPGVDWSEVAARAAADAADAADATDAAHAADAAEASADTASAGTVKKGWSEVASCEEGGEDAQAKESEAIDAREAGGVAAGAGTDDGAGDAGDDGGGGGGSGGGSGGGGGGFGSGADDSDGSSGDDHDDDNDDEQMQQRMQQRKQQQRKQQQSKQQEGPVMLPRDASLEDKLTAFYAAYQPEKLVTVTAAQTQTHKSL